MNSSEEKQQLAHDILQQKDFTDIMSVLLSYFADEAKVGDHLADLYTKKLEELRSS